jgi:hypothetical protein
MRKYIYTRSSTFVPALSAYTSTLETHNQRKHLLKQTLLSTPPACHAHTVWNRVHTENLIVAQLVRESPNLVVFRSSADPTAWSRVLLGMLRAGYYYLVKKFPSFYDIQRVFTLYTTAHHWLLSWVRRNQATPSSVISLMFNLTLSSHLRVGLPSGLFPNLTVFTKAYNQTPLRTSSILILSWYLCICF